MDKFYGRLEIANDGLAALTETNSYYMYVFAELDNLEYVIEKYRLGYMSPEQALRGPNTFRSRLKGPNGGMFLEVAKEMLGKAAYSDNTRSVVRRTIARVEKTPCRKIHRHP